MRPSLPATDFVKNVLLDPAHPELYWDMLRSHIGEISHSVLARLSRSIMVITPDDRDIRHIYENAVRLSDGEDQRRNVLPKSTETRSVSFAGHTLMFQSGRGPSEIFFGRVMPEGQVHEAGLLSYLSTRLCNRETLVDIGAHIGYVSCFAAAFGGTVLAIEMQPTLVPIIAANAAMNDLWRVHPINAAIGSRPGLAQALRLDPSPGLRTESERLDIRRYPESSLSTTSFCACHSTPSSLITVTHRASSRSISKVLKPWPSQARPI